MKAVFTNRSLTALKGYFRKHLSGKVFFQAHLKSGKGHRLKTSGSMGSNSPDETTSGGSISPET